MPCFPVWLFSAKLYALASLLLPRNPRAAWTDSCTLVYVLYDLHLHPLVCRVFTRGADSRCTDIIVIFTSWKLLSVDMALFRKA
ncbi:hypothetical protein SLA2020_508170 [Shorea laevis]